MGGLRARLSLVLVTLFCGLITCCRCHGTKLDHARSPVQVESKSALQVDNPSQSPTLKQYFLGGFAVRHNEFGNGIREAVNMILESVNAAQILLEGSVLNITWSLSGCDSDSDVTVAFVEWLKLAFMPTGNGQQKSFVGILGGVCSGASKRIASMAAPFYYAQISGGASLPALSDRTLYPTFFRTIVADSGVSKVFARLAVLANWRQLAVVVADKEVEPLFLSLRAEADALGYLMVKRIDMQADCTDVKFAVQLLVSSAIRPVLVLGYVDALRCLVCEAALSVKPWGAAPFLFLTLGWMKEDWWAKPTARCSAAVMVTAAAGHFAVSTVKYTSNSSDPLVCYNNRTPKDFLADLTDRVGTPLAPSIAGQADAACAWVLAIRNLRQNGRFSLDHPDESTLKDVMESITNVDFWGMSGHIHWRQDSPDQTPSRYHILQCRYRQQDSDRLLRQVVLSYNPELTTFGRSSPEADWWLGDEVLTDAEWINWSGEYLDGPGFGPSSFLGTPSQANHLLTVLLPLFVLLAVVLTCFCWAVVNRSRRAAERHVVSLLHQTQTLSYKVARTQSWVNVNEWFAKCAPEVQALGSGTSSSSSAYSGTYNFRGPFIEGLLSVLCVIDLDALDQHKHAFLGTCDDRVDRFIQELAPQLRQAFSSLCDIEGLHLTQLRVTVVLNGQILGSSAASLQGESGNTYSRVVALCDFSKYILVFCGSCPIADAFESRDLWLYDPELDHSRALACLSASFLKSPAERFVWNSNRLSSLPSATENQLQKFWPRARAVLMASTKKGRACKLAHIGILDAQNSLLQLWALAVSHGHRRVDGFDLKTLFVDHKDLRMHNHSAPERIFKMLDGSCQPLCVHGNRNSPLLQARFSVDTITEPGASRRPEQSWLERRMVVMCSRIHSGAFDDLNLCRYLLPSQQPQIREALELMRNVESCLCCLPTIKFNIEHSASLQWYSFLMKLVVPKLHEFFTTYLEKVRNSGEEVLSELTRLCHRNDEDNAVDHDILGVVYKNLHCDQEYANLVRCVTNVGAPVLAQMSLRNASAAIDLFIQALPRHKLLQNYCDGIVGHVGIGCRRDEGVDPPSLFRIIEKSALHKEFRTHHSNMFSTEHIFDAARAILFCDTFNIMQLTFQRIVDEGILNICGVGPMMESGTVSRFMKFVVHFKEDMECHLCELLLVHTKLCFTCKGSNYDALPYGSTQSQVLRRVLTTLGVDVPFHPSFWCLSFKQLNEFAAHAKAMLKHRYTVVTMADIVSEVIIPLTKSTGKSYACMVNEQMPRKIDMFVSHCWAENFQTFMQSVDAALRNKVNKNDTNLWICSFALLQSHDSKVVKAQVGSRLLEAPFELALRHASDFLIVRNDQIDLYSRAWCVYEVFRARQLNIRIQVVGPKAFVAGRVDVMSCTATDLADELQIKHVIKQANEEDKVNSIVTEIKGIG